MTTAQIGKESLTDSIELKVDVYTKGPSQGRTYKSDDGRIVRVVNHVNHDEFFNYITSLAKKYLINFKCKLLYKTVYISGIIFFIKGGNQMSTKI